MCLRVPVLLLIVLLYAESIGDPALCQIPNREIGKYYVTVPKCGANERAIQTDFFYMALSVKSIDRRN